MPLSRHPIAGPVGPQGIQGAPGISAGRIFYHDATTASDIAGYKVLRESPSANPESTIAVTVTGTSDVAVANFATLAGVPGAVDYPPGTAYRRIYANVSGGVARLHLQVYKRDVAGVETLVRDEFSPSFSNTTVALQDWVVSAPNGGSMATTDRIVNKLYAQRVSGATTFTVTVHFEGPSTASHIQTTISVGAAGTSGVTSGTFTPTLTNAANVAASTAYPAFYYRVLDRVTVAGRVDITPTATGAATVLYLSLPVAFDVTASGNVAGTATAPGISGASAALYGDVTNDRVMLSFVPTSTQPASWMYSYSYIAPTVTGVPPGVIDDTAYSSAWDGKTTAAPSQNAVYDAITALNIISGLYTPTLTNQGNVGAFNAYPSTYFRVGNAVVVTGLADVDPVAAAAATAISISLPIASDLQTEGNLGGSINSITVAQQSGGVYADYANNRAMAQFISATAATSIMSYLFAYRVL